MNYEQIDPQDAGNTNKKSNCSTSNYGINCTCFMIFRKGYVQKDSLVVFVNSVNKWSSWPVKECYRVLLKHRFFFSSQIRFLLACEEKQASKKKVRERAKRVKSQKMRGKSEHLSHFQIMRVKNPASKIFKCE